MDEQVQFLSWQETPRMRWRALGFIPYLRRLGLSMLIFAAVGGALPLYFGLVGGGEWWHAYSLWDVLSLPAICMAGRLATELVPGSVALGNGKLSLKRPLEQGQWFLRTCHVMDCTNVGGVLRLNVEVPRGGTKGGTRTIIIAARVKYAQMIRSILEASGSTGLADTSEPYVGSETPDLSFGDSMAVPKPPVQGSLLLVNGFILIGIGAYVSWLALELCLTPRHIRAVWPISFFAFGLTLISGGVLCLRRRKRLG